MCHSDHRDYYLRRAAECRESAKRAVDKGVRRVHLDFASRYEQAAEEADPAGEELADQAA